jgi:hypothetical protein
MQNISSSPVAAVVPIMLAALLAAAVVLAVCFRVHH